MADPAYNGGGLIGFDETTTGGNTNSGNNSSTPNPPKSPPPPIPTPPRQSNPPQPKPQKTILDELSSVSKPITPSKKPASKNIRKQLKIMRRHMRRFKSNETHLISVPKVQHNVEINIVPYPAWAVCVPCGFWRSYGVWWVCPVFKVKH